MKKIKVPHNKQDIPYSCGPACLDMMLKYCGKKISEKELTFLCRTNNKTGTSHKNLILAAKKVGFKCYPKSNGTLRDITHRINNCQPTMVNYFDASSKEGHYAVICGYNKRKATIIMNDPWYGKDFEMKWSNFKKIWHNHNKSSSGWMMTIEELASDSKKNRRHK